MKVSIKAKIWSTVSAVVFVFAYFIYFYFPNQQKEQVLKSYHKDAQNLANTVSLGVQIALDEQNFHGVQMAMDFIKEDSNLVFAAIVQESFNPFTNKTDYKVFQTYPDNYPLELTAATSDSIIVKYADFKSELLGGKIVLGVSTVEVKKEHARLRTRALVITIGVLLLGISIGYLLARNISRALNLMKIHSSRVAQGNLGIQLNMGRKDEIGDLSNAFDQMVIALKEADEQLHEYNEELKTKSEQILYHSEKTQESIRYAQVIQEAFLPNIEDFKKVFPNSFISYIPKDIVSGDFYFFSEVNSQYLFGVFDCTGHGVPGGFMSVMGSVYLNNIVHQGVSKPSEILQLLDAGIVNSLNQKVEGSRTRDGMDGSLCSMDIEANKLYFSGAYNSLYILRGDEWLRIKADRKSIGGGMDLRSNQFECHEIDLLSGDNLYLLSDGFVDQFGGDEDKKYTIGKFKNFILSIKDRSMEEQKSLLEKEFFDWRGVGSQIDDVLVMGVRV